MEKASDIRMIRYTEKAFDPFTMSYSRRIYTLYPEGLVTCALYAPGSRKMSRKEESRRAGAEDFRQMCAELNACLESADRLDKYVDDCGAEARIHRPFGRVDTVDRGYGNAETDVGNIISEYLYTTAGMDWNTLW